MPSFTEALTLFAQEDPANLIAIRELRVQAFAMIVAGGGEIAHDLSGTIGGKSFTFEVKKDCTELFTDLTSVLASIDSDVDINARASSFDFTGYSQH